MHEQWQSLFNGQLVLEVHFFFSLVCDLLLMFLDRISIDRFSKYWCWVSNATVSPIYIIITIILDKEMDILPKNKVNCLGFCNSLPSQQKYKIPLNLAEDLIWSKKYNERQR